MASTYAMRLQPRFAEFHDGRVRNRGSDNDGDRNSWRRRVRDITFNGEQRFINSLA